MGVVVDVERRLGQAADGVADLRPVALRDSPGAQQAGVDAGLSCQQALGELEVAHLHREEHDGPTAKVRLAFVEHLTKFANMARS